MELRFAPLELATFDELKTEVLCLWMFSDERPPRGAPGLVDWRLCGQLSRLLDSGAYGAESDRALLMPPPPRRLAAERLLVLGAGPRAAIDAPRSATLVNALIDRVLALRVRTAAIALPHASLPWWDAADAVDALLAAVQRCDELLDEITLIDTHEAQRAMEPRIERAKRRALAQL